MLKSTRRKSSKMCVCLCRKKFKRTTAPHSFFKIKSSLSFVIWLLEPQTRVKPIPHRQKYSINYAQHTEALKNTAMHQAWTGCFVTRTPRLQRRHYSDTEHAGASTDSDSHQTTTTSWPRLDFFLSLKTTTTTTNKKTLWTRLIW